MPGVKDSKLVTMATIKLFYNNSSNDIVLFSVKATLPLFTVILMRLCFREKQTLPVSICKNGSELQKRWAFLMANLDTYIEMICLQQRCFYCTCTCKHITSSSHQMFQWFLLRLRYFCLSWLLNAAVFIYCVNSLIHQKSNAFTLSI